MDNNNDHLNNGNNADSDAEDDPGHMLNVWLGELNTLKKVKNFY